MKVILLARSDKYRTAEGGYCVAGVDYDDPTRWIRLNGLHDHFKITDAEAVYENGSICQPLDVVEVQAGKIDQEFIDMGMAHGWGGDQALERLEDYDENMFSIQPENYYVENRFRFVERIEINDLLNMVPVYGGRYIFSNRARSLSVGEAIRNNHSLALVKVQNLELYPVKKFNQADVYKSHYSAKFDYNGVHYENISVTDPDYAAELTNFEGIAFAETYLLMSVGVNFMDRHYKLIAKIFEVVYTVENNRLNLFHAYRDCRYLQPYPAVKHALWGDLISNGLHPCKECQDRLNDVRQQNRPQQIEL